MQQQSCYTRGEYSNQLEEKADIAMMLGYSLIRRTLLTS